MVGSFVTHIHNTMDIQRRRYPINRERVALQHSNNFIDLWNYIKDYITSPGLIPNISWTYVPI